MDGDIFYADGTPISIVAIPNNNIKFCVIYPDGTYSINPDLTAEQYKQALGMVIEYFTKGKQ